LIYNNHIEIKLQDFGPGIEDVDKAMQERFSTATETIRNLGFGAGMGLPNMKKYSDNMKIETEVGKGTTVHLLINFELK
jgi:anti-sigma regulatory factor (Ser/Thr protein kinase)